MTTRIAKITKASMFLLIASLVHQAACQKAPAAAAEDAKLMNRISSLEELPTSKKAELSGVIQDESAAHFGFPALKSVGDLGSIKVVNLSTAQKLLLNQVTDHVVIQGLSPLIVTAQGIKNTGTQLYPELQEITTTLETPEIQVLAGKVGRIRYWVKNGLAANQVQDGLGYSAGTGFVIGPGMIATACHVAYAITDAAGDLSNGLWTKVDFGATSDSHETYLVTGILGRGTIQGLDYAILAVSTSSEVGAIPLPGPMVLGSDSTTKFVGIIGYPDLNAATYSCSQQNATNCDDTDRWFIKFASSNPGVIKIISPGKKTGDSSPHGFPIITYDAPTTNGQSGSPVIDLVTKQVVGLHYCCTGAAPSANEPTCAQLQPISLGDKSDNEALAIKNVVIPQ